MSWEIEIENIAGIRDGRATLKPGMNVVRGTNSRGKSSFVSAVGLAMGVEAPLTEGEERGLVVLRTDDRTLTVELVRSLDRTRSVTGEVAVRGESYLTEPEDVAAAEAFAILDGRNPVRRAVLEGRNLESALTRPLDLADIEAKIEALRAERATLDDRLDDVSDDLDQRPALDRRIDRLTRQLSSVEDELDEIGSAESSATGRRTELAERRAERKRLEGRSDRLEQRIEQLQRELEDRRAVLEGLSVSEEDVLDERISAAREHAEIAALEADLVRSVYAATRRVLDQQQLDLLTEVERGLLTDELTCWCCGATTDVATIEEHLDVLGERANDRQQEADQRRHRVDELDREREELDERRNEQNRLTAEIDELESALADRRDALADTRALIERVRNEVDSLSSRVSGVDERVTELEVRRRRLSAELDEAQQERERFCERRTEYETLVETRERLTDELDTLRERRDQVHHRTREAFTEAIDMLVSDLELGFEAARITADFELIVARNGRTVGLDALAEGERELLSLAAGLAGHEAFDVAETVPVLLLDELGGLATATLNTLVSHVNEQATFVVLTAFPEQHELDGHEIDPSEWSVVSDE